MQELNAGRKNGPLTILSEFLQESKALKARCRIVPKESSHLDNTILICIPEYKIENPLTLIEKHGSTRAVWFVSNEYRKRRFGAPQLQEWRESVCWRPQKLQRITHHARRVCYRNSQASQVAKRFFDSCWVQRRPHHATLSVSKKATSVVPFDASHSHSRIFLLTQNSRLGVNNNDEWKDFAHFDNKRAYTRNLIATDHCSYTLLLLCWNPGRFSPIHDHPCDGCWMRVLEGQIQECRYQHDDALDKLVCTQDKTFAEGGLVFIEDSLGYHKVGNPSSTLPAVTLHLYSPPFQSCKMWLDENRKPCQSGICNYSEYGKKL
jgi:cysteine dioxygenase